MVVGSGPVLRPTVRRGGVLSGVSGKTGEVVDALANASKGSSPRGEVDVSNLASSRDVTNRSPEALLSLRFLTSLALLSTEGQNKSRKREK